jgi:hypothetical protein
VIVLVSGPWDRFFLTQHIGEYLQEAGWADEVYMLVHGDDPGMDDATKCYARAKQLPNVEFPTQTGYGGRARHLRNVRMVDFLWSMKKAGHRVGALVVQSHNSVAVSAIETRCRAYGIECVVNHSLLESVA